MDKGEATICIYIYTYIHIYIHTYIIYIHMCIYIYRQTRSNLFFQETIIAPSKHNTNSGPHGIDLSLQEMTL